MNKNLKLLVCSIGITTGLLSCGVDMPKETQTSYETMTVKKSDIELPYKFSARMKGQNDVTVTPQVSASWSWKPPRPTFRQHWQLRAVPSWSTSQTKTFLTRRL